MAVSMACASVINSFVNAYPNKKLLNYSVFEQIKDIMPSFLLSLGQDTLNRLPIWKPPVSLQKADPPVSAVSFLFLLLFFLHNTVCISRENKRKGPKSP